MFLCICGAHACSNLNSHQHLCGALGGFSNCSWLKRLTLKRPWAGHPVEWPQTEDVTTVPWKQFPQVTDWTTCFRSTWSWGNNVGDSASLPGNTRLFEVILNWCLLSHCSWEQVKEFKTVSPRLLFLTYYTSQFSKEFFEYNLWVNGTWVRVNGF